MTGGYVNEQENCCDYRQSPEEGECFHAGAGLYPGAESSGNTVTEFFLNGMDIHGCKGCFGGHSSRECPCVQKDDMAQIYPAVLGIGC